MDAALPWGRHQEASERTIEALLSASTPEVWIMGAAAWVHINSILDKRDLLKRCMLLEYKYQPRATFVFSTYSGEAV